MLAAEERHDRQMADLRGELHRAIRFGVEEHRRERVRRHELEDQMKQLAAGQAELRKWMQKWLERSGNGHPASS